jgi:2'-5' RNA ligase
MHGIVSLLDAPHYQLVEDLWAELRYKFGVTGVYVTPYPHFSYQVASHYDVNQLTESLQHFATHHAPFIVHTTGLGLFTGPSPVLYIPVVRSPKLTALHQALWQQSLSAGSSILQYYSSDQWVPHITIGFGDLNSGNLPPIMHHLSTLDFAWEIVIDNIALIYDTGTRQELRGRFALNKNISNY